MGIPVTLLIGKLSNKPSVTFYSRKLRADTDKLSVLENLIYILTGLNSGIKYFSSFFFESNWSFFCGKSGEPISFLLLFGYKKLEKIRLSLL